MDVKLFINGSLASSVSIEGFVGWMLCDGVKQPCSGAIRGFNKGLYMYAVRHGVLAHEPLSCDLTCTLHSALCTGLASARPKCMLFMLISEKDDRHAQHRYDRLNLTNTVGALPIILSTVTAVLQMRCCCYCCHCEEIQVISSPRVARRPIPPLDVSFVCLFNFQNQA